MPRPPRNVVLSWLGLIVLMSMTLGLAYVPMGSMNLVVALAIAAAKALIVALVFMKLARGVSLRWVFAGAGLFWLMFFFGLTFTDYASRSSWPAQ